MKRKFKQLQEKLIKQLLHEIVFTERIDLKSVKYLLYLIFSYETHGTKTPEWLVSSNIYDEYQTQGEYIKSQLMYLYRKHRPAWKYKYKQMKTEEEFTEWVLEEPTGCLTAARFMYPEVQGNLLKDCVAINLVNAHISVLMDKYDSVFEDQLKNYLMSPQQILQQIIDERNITVEKAQDNILALVLSAVNDSEIDPVQFEALSDVEKEVYKSARGAVYQMKRCEEKEVPAHILLEKKLAQVIKKGAEILRRECVICSITNEGFIVKKSNSLNTAIKKIE